MAVSMTACVLKARHTATAVLLVIRPNIRAPAQHPIFFFTQACFAIRFVYSDMRIYRLNIESESGITPSVFPDQDKP
jgi:hypothetical protein